MSENPQHRSLYHRLKAADRGLYFALFATLFFGASGGIFQATLNNYLNDVHNLGAEARGWLEFPRELPGFLIMFAVSGLALLMRETKMAALAMFFSGVGAIGLGYMAPGTTLLVLWIVIWSFGDHIIFVVEGVIGLQLSKQGAEGHRLGQFGGARNLGTIIGVGVVFLLAKMIGDNYRIFYAIAGTSAGLAAILYLRISIKAGVHKPRKLVYKAKYKIFYAISALFGIRKQIFLAFGGWVLVSLHGVPVSTVALLYFISACIGVLFRPLLGDVIDWLGERIVLSVDELMIIAICMTYAFADFIFPARFVLWALYIAYVLDAVLFALRVARTTYLKKIADDPADITPTMSVGVTIDHSVAMTLPILSGYIWEVFGYQWVFVLASAIALAGFFVCLQIKVPDNGLEKPD